MDDAESRETGSGLVDVKGTPLGGTAEMVERGIKDAQKTPEGFGTALKFEPTGHRVLVEELPMPDKAIPGGKIFVPPAWKQKSCRGVLLAAGPLARKYQQYVDCRIGDVVYWARFAGVQFPWRGRLVLILNAKDILANESLAERLDAGEVEYQLGRNRYGEEEVFLGSPPSASEEKPTVPLLSDYER